MKYFKYCDYGKRFIIKPSNYFIDEQGIFPQLRGKSLRILFFYVYWEKHNFWFRIFGYGIAGKSLSKHWKIYFSERNGFRKMYKLFGWKFELLK